MSEDIKITSETKQKNPKRVEQGKRLAAMSKEAKERKARERLLAEQEQEKEQDSGGRSSKYIIGIILIAGVGAGTYYMYENYKSKNKIQKQEHKVQSEQPKVKNEQQDEKLINLFD